MILEYYISVLNDELKKEIDARVEVMKRVHKTSVVVQCYCGSEQIAKSLARYYRSKGVGVSGARTRVSLVYRYTGE